MGLLRPTGQFDAVTIPGKMRIHYIKPVNFTDMYIFVARVWIDANDMLHHGYWKTGNNQRSLPYWGFGPNEPSRADEHCADMDRGYGYRWSDFHCSYKFHFICEYHM